MNFFNKLSLVAVLGLAMLGGSGTAKADDPAGRRTNGLEKDVAVRHRRLLVAHRFELTPLFESTIDADFRHIIGGGLKLEYHFSDMLSFGAIGVASTSINTGLVNKITATLPANADPNSKDPSVEQFTDHLNSMPFHGAAYLSLTPWYGKLAAFSQAYVAFDFYFQAGIAFAQLQSNCPTNVCSDKAPGMSTTNPDPTGQPIPPDFDPRNDPPLNNGGRLGLYLGGGIHVFLSDFIALDLTVRDYAFSDNPSGADFDANRYVDDKDSRFIHHLFFGIGVAIMFPTTVKRTP
jgi:outer membrane beta-barrel protein